MARSRVPDWSSGLPSELLEAIRGHLASGTDAASFWSVCSPWRDAVPFASCFALLLLLPFVPDSDALTLYNVAEEKAFSMPLPDDLELCEIWKHADRENLAAVRNGHGRQQRKECLSLSSSPLPPRGVPGGSQPRTSRCEILEELYWLPHLLAARCHHSRKE